jgi:hypothetical protein
MPARRVANIPKTKKSRREAGVAKIVSLASDANPPDPPGPDWRPIAAPDFLGRKLCSGPSVTESIVVTGPPFGITEFGSNSQSTPSGAPVHENCTGWLNPFAGVTVTVAIPACVALTVTLDGATESVKVPTDVMLIESGADVDVEKFASPLYFAVIEFAPAGRVVVEKLAEPDPFSVPVPRVVAPLENVTVPVGTFVPLAGVTLAINVTLAPDVAVAGPVSVVVVPISTVCVIALEVLAAKFASPLYFAVIVFAPATNVEVKRSVTPPACKGALPSVVAPSKNVTVPVMVPAVLEVTVASKPTVPPRTEGFSVETIVIEVAALAAAFIVSVSIDDVLVANFVSPLYFAVME